MKRVVAIIQKPPVVLNFAETIDRMLSLIAEAANEGAELLIFPEAYLPGYPTWIWRLRPGTDKELCCDIHALLRQNAVNIDRGDLVPLQNAAKFHAVTLLVGMNEIDTDFSCTTLFNTVVVIGADGAIINRHRKLMPTNPERMIWGMGDAAGLKVVDTPLDRLGSLICWESYMPLARYSLYAQNMEIFVNPTWDSGEMHIASMRHFAREGGCWVLAGATAMQSCDIPQDFPSRDELFGQEEWINEGGAVVVNPSGEIIAGPLNRMKDFLYAEIDIEAARKARRSLDVCGHYSRSDIFSLSVNRQPFCPVEFKD